MPGGAAWYTDNDNTITGLPGHTESNDVDGCCAPANVTNVLTITNVSMRRSYVCAQGLGRNQVISNRSFLTVLGELVKCFCIFTYICMHVCIVTIKSMCMWTRKSFKLIGLSIIKIEECN